jgi:hypothetical protein
VAVPVSSPRASEEFAGGTPPERFAAALRALYTAAGAPPYRVLVRQGAGQRPQVKLTDSSLSDWINGRSVPADLAAVRFLVGYLESIAGRRGHQARGHGWWSALHAQARQFIYAKRGDLPESRATTTATTARQRVGRPIRSYTPLALEVHRAIDVFDSVQPGDDLTPYVERDHDIHIREVVDAVADGASRMLVLVGGSSTGKTRACWQAIQCLPDRWWLWHPIDPSRTAAAALELSQVRPYTVAWLNDAQHYLLTADPALGERVAAGLRTLLRDEARGPVLILATIWPEFWSTLTSQPTDGSPDPYAQARELLAGADIRVPDRFTARDMQALHIVADGDPRMRHAAQHAKNGRITQHLAGVPELLRRYRNAPAVARALIDTAIDIRRLGHPPHIPDTLLEQVAPGYLNDHDWNQAGNDWLQQALVYTGWPCHGVPGPLTRIRPRPADPPTPGGHMHYQLADYLEQVGRIERAAVFPPISFWQAAATIITDPDAQRAIGRHAEVRGRYRRAAIMYQKAASRDHPGALWDLACLLERAGYRDGIEALHQRSADHGNPYALQRLAERQEHAGHHAEAEALAFQAADRGNTLALPALVDLRYEAGKHLDGLTTLELLRAVRGEPVARIDARGLAMRAADCGHFEALRTLAFHLEQDGDHDGSRRLYWEATDRGDLEALRTLGYLRRLVGDYDAADTLYQQAADRGDVKAVRDLGYVRELVGDRAAAETHYRQAAARGYARAVRDLTRLREEAGDHDGAESAALQAAERGDSLPLYDLGKLREQTGDIASAETLYRQAASCGNSDAWRFLAKLRESGGDPAGAETMYLQAIDHGDHRAIRDLALLRQRTGNPASATTLHRQAVDHGYHDALDDLANLLQQTGDTAGADCVRRFGLADDGSVATSLDFNLLGSPAPTTSGQ